MGAEEVFTEGHMGQVGAPDGTGGEEGNQKAVAGAGGADVLRRGRLVQGLVDMIDPGLEQEVAGNDLAGLVRVRPGPSLQPSQDPGQQYDIGLMFHDPEHLP